MAHEIKNILCGCVWVGGRGVGGGGRGVSGGGEKGTGEVIHLFQTVRGGGGVGGDWEDDFKLHWNIQPLRIFILFSP